jgi:tRNA (cytidine/uridine-2'-O-)-methyltransferase
MVSLALYQPDIPQNTGAVLRLCACLGVEVHVIEPAGFDLSDRRLRRAGMDYLAQVRLVRHRSWPDFEGWRSATGRRLVLLTTQAAMPYADFGYESGDIVMVGRESGGVPEAVHAASDARVIIPMIAGLRSLNVATAAAMVLGEAQRQTGDFPAAAPSRATPSGS